jgi:hypothetical protein
MLGMMLIPTKTAQKNAEEGEGVEGKAEEEGVEKRRRRGI